VLLRGKIQDEEGRQVVLADAEVLEERGRVGGGEEGEAVSANGSLVMRKERNERGPLRA